MAHPNIIIQQNYTPAQQRTRRLESLAYPGRRSGNLAGSHIDELSSLRKAILLCWECKHKFDHMRHEYYYEKHMRVSGRCDGCERHRKNSHLYIHESVVVQNGKSRHGDAWLPQ